MDKKILRCLQCVVKGITTLFILGNDFADQYTLSIIGGDNGIQLVFADTGRKVPVENSIRSTFLDEKGHAFLIKISQKGNSDNAKAHQKSRRQKRKIKSASESTAVKSLEDTITPPESVKTVSVQLNFPAGSDSAHIEKSSSLIVEMKIYMHLQIP